MQIHVRGGSKLDGMTQVATKIAFPLYLLFIISLYVNLENESRVFLLDVVASFRRQIPDRSPETALGNCFPLSTTGHEAIHARYGCP